MATSKRLWDYSTWSDISTSWQYHSERYKIDSFISVECLVTKWIFNFVYIFDNEKFTVVYLVFRVYVLNITINCILHTEWQCTIHSWVNPMYFYIAHSAKGSSSHDPTDQFLMREFLQCLVFLSYHIYGTNTNYIRFV